MQPSPASVRSRPGWSRLLRPVLLLSLSWLTGCEQTPPLLVATHTPAPSFVLERLGGGEARFPEDYGGRVVAIRFWANWCPYCQSEMRDLEPAYRKLRERNLVMLAVNVAEPEEKVAAFVKAVDLSAEVLLDRNGQVMRDYGVMGLPVTLFVDPSGRIRHRIIGESNVATFERVALELLKEGGTADGAAGASRTDVQ
jgi:cytochrome c biogenesis protein CcmG, thiol:disulfide interchange protein DsbE